MKHTTIACTAFAALVLAGCTTPTVRTRPGAFFTLSSRNVAYRDLTQPFGVDNDSTDRTYASFPASMPVAPPAYIDEPTPSKLVATHTAPAPTALPRTPIVQTAKLNPLKVPAYTPVYVPPKPAETTAINAVPAATTKASPVDGPAAKQLKVASVAKASSVAPVVRDSWDAQPTELFHEVINSWASLAGWNVLWQYGPNFPPHPGHFTGVFPDAATAFTNQYLGADDPPHLCFYPDQQPKPLVRVIHGTNCD